MSVQVPAEMPLGHAVRYAVHSDGATCTTNAAASSVRRPARPDRAGRKAGREAASPWLAAGVFDEQRPVAEVDDQRDGRVGDHRQVGRLFRPGAEPGHLDPGRRARPGRDRDVPHRRGGSKRLGGSHTAMV